MSKHFQSAQRNFVFNFLYLSKCILNQCSKDLGKNVAFAIPILQED